MQKELVFQRCQKEGISRHIWKWFRQTVNRASVRWKNKICLSKPNNWICKEWPTATPSTCTDSMWEVKWLLRTQKFGILCKLPNFLCVQEEPEHLFAAQRLQQLFRTWCAISYTLYSFFTLIKTRVPPCLYALIRPVFLFHVVPAACRVNTGLLVPGCEIRPLTHMSLPSYESAFEWISVMFMIKTSLTGRFWGQPMTIRLSLTQLPLLWYSQRIYYVGPSMGNTEAMACEECYI